MQDHAAFQGKKPTAQLIFHGLSAAIGSRVKWLGSAEVGVVFGRVMTVGRVRVLVGDLIARSLAEGVAHLDWHLGGWILQ